MSTVRLGQYEKNRKMEEGTNVNKIRSKCTRAKERLEFSN
jgi:hypothetical protein